MKPNRLKNLRGAFFVIPEMLLAVIAVLGFTLQYPNTVNLLIWIVISFVFIRSFFIIRQSNTWEKLTKLDNYQRELLIHRVSTYQSNLDYRVVATMTVITTAVFFCYGVYFLAIVNAASVTTAIIVMSKTAKFSRLLSV